MRSGDTAGRLAGRARPASRGLGAAFCGAIVLLASACSHLPVNGPNHRAIEGDAKESVIQDRGDIAADYVLVDINRNVLQETEAVGPESFFRTFGTGKGPSPEIRIGVGDILTVSIFEASVGGLFAPPEDPRRGAAPLALPAQTVDHKGNIFVPYAGEIKAAGRSAAQVQRDIERRLDKRAIEPQVVVTITEQNATEVSIFGDAAGLSLKVRIKPGGERVLDLVAKAGVRFPGYEVFVSLQRGSRRATVFLPVLISRPEENIFVQPGDVLYMFRQPQNFVIMGAVGTVTQTTGLTGRFNFESERISLAEAVARAGGLLDTRADPRQVFLYRWEHRDVLKRMGLNLTRFPADKTLIPTIYRANYRDPSIFFAANQFPMRHRDIIYVANADAVELEKFLNYIRLMTSTVAGVASDAAVTRDAFRPGGL